jgi:RND family efflux transporter MFP subunit
MTPAARVNVPWTVLAAGALGLVAVGAGAAYLSLRSSVRTPQVVRDSAATSSPRPPSMPDRGAPSAAIASTSLPDVVVPLSKEGAERAGITVTAVTAGAPSGGLRAPAVVEPNAYKVVAVTPVIGGRITRVTVELGQHVQRGQTIAQIFSPELAESQTRYIAARAELEAHERELARTVKLVEIGSASRQELEGLHAEHTSRRAGLQSAASRLRLLGLSDGAIEALDPGHALDATISVPAPIAGVVTERMANVGLNVDQATKLFTVVDLSSVWVVADVYENDFARVTIGTSAHVTTPAYPNLVLQGRVSYIDPQVSAASRTAKVRIEVPNARGELRLGMFVEVLLAADGRASAVIPRSAVQNVGDRSVVYLVDPAHSGQFVEREVRLGPPAGEQFPVLAGVGVGDAVVSRGSFSVRAERERLGLRSATTQAAADAGAPPPKESVQTASIAVGEQGYEPARVSLRAGVPARLTFVRTTDKTCGTEIVFPSLNITRALPLNEAVVIELTPSKAGDIAFVCGINMLKGVVVVSDR